MNKDEISLIGGKIDAITPYIGNMFDHYWWSNYNEYYSSFSNSFSINYLKLKNVLDDNFEEINIAINTVNKLSQFYNEYGLKRVMSLFLGRHKEYNDVYIYLSYDQNYIDYKICWLNSEVNNQIVLDVDNKLLECERKMGDEEKRPTIDLIVEGYSGLELATFYYNIPEIDLNLNYGEEWAIMHDKLIEKLSVDNKAGITLLHGAPGTGKSMYIRYLSYLLSDKKKVIYVPNNMVNVLTTPTFIRLLIDNPNSILVIEDAEEVLKSRDDNGQIVDKVLNISDGILSDFLGIHILCTYNTEKENIDKALLRQGRLTLKYQFKELEVDNAKKLAKKLKVDESKINEKIVKPMTLAEIYSLTDNELTPSFISTKRPIGFITNDEIAPVKKLY